ncbi:type II secretion system minor pseudopilin GspI [Cypionkella sp. TWP1-2-1b2]|uniref:type II secretion system minor pseudopilin GspI n=1 Tax=Cypionkella sp. TWP1-2-1b2 TaxID=2804675 RepID=UPI003CF013A4
MINTRSPESGFTLIETLVALVILAMSAISLLGATEAHINRIGALENRAAAQWVLENYLAEMTLGLSPTPTPAAMNGAAFAVAVNLVPTQDTDLAQVDLTARGATDGRDYSRLTGFVDTTSKGLPAP